MTDPNQATRVVDTHQHLWMMSERAYDWIVPAYGPLYADFGPEDIADEADAVGISATVLVQAADTYEDTFYMLSVAAREERVKGVVGWVPLDRPGEAEAALDLYAPSPYVKGVRALTHTYEDPRWILRDDVAESISLLAPRGLALDYVATTAEHLELVPELAGRHPDLKIVIDHMAKPDIASGAWEPWATQIRAAAALPNVFIKISGLNTASGAEWTAADWQPYVDHVLEVFTADRTMLGSDWPVIILAGDLTRVWNAQLEVISGRTEAEREAVRWGTAASVYGLEF
ncbi:amidohydrolase family protein [Microbacterium sulfonylureivorans]|uniref:amidohydrolase family protein n=1 Tax=Microbacterium sulfonylureivorans TaxID=2486854 RepID=UPI000FDC6476|nr:amidohydrolase family protein [Microbacterium sulfonylureivorans]